MKGLDALRSALSIGVLPVFIGVLPVFIGVGSAGMGVGPDGFLLSVFCEDPV